VADVDWCAVATFPNRPTAEAIAGLLAAENMPHRIVSNDDLPGLGFNFSVCVPSALEHRARWFLDRVKISDGELSYLATGKLSSDDL
jgi:hypothetical protein